MDPLIDASELSDWPGAPFASSQVAAASEQIRDLCGWHIAPVVTETVTVDSDGSTVLLLPSLKISEVNEVRDVTGDSPKVLDAWRLSGSGILYRQARWPAGVAALEVDLTHGYEECPKGLYPVIAERAQFIRRDRSVGQESLGSRSLSMRSERPSASEGMTTNEEVLARYTVTAGA